MKLFQRGRCPPYCARSRSPWPPMARAATIDPARFLDDIKFLASKDMKGRGTGTPELEKAAAFIAAKFRSFGLAAD